MPKFSIIIPVVTINDYVRESIRHLLNQSEQNFDIFIFPNQATEESFSKTRIIPTGKIGPAEKRNLALKYAQGEIFAFLDDDAYPTKHWLKIAAQDFQNINITALGGPAVTPPDNSIAQKASGASLAASTVAGINSRYWPGKNKKLIQDWPSVNLLIRRDIFKKINGFNVDYWPGEDTKLCLDIIQNNGKILYDPNLIVYHHRRKNIYEHLKQISGYGLHRGFFAKKFPSTSLKLSYFLPSLFVIFLSVGLIISLILKSKNYVDALYIYLILLGFYFLIILWSAILTASREKNIFVGLLVIPYSLLTHIVYGLKFIQGLLTQSLKSKLRK